MKKTSLKNEYKVDQDFIFGSMTKVGRRSINATEKISQCHKSRLAITIVPVLLG